MASDAIPMPGSHARPDRGEGVFSALCFASATLLLAALAGIVLSLAVGGWPVFQRFGLGFLTSSEWNPVTDRYGAAGPIVGTLVTSLLALAIALPLAVGVAIFLVEYCPRALARPLGLAIELLAGVPSIVYGMWGLFVLAPWFARHVQLPLMMATDPDSPIGRLLDGAPNGANLLTASLILAIMILPYMAAVFRDLLRTVPPELREAAYGLGATSFETMTQVLLPYVRRGALGVTLLGFGRALGETMAVTFVVGNAHRLPASLFDSGSTIASTIANEFTEATGAMHGAALVALGFVLFLLTFAVLGLARLMLAAPRP